MHDSFVYTLPLYTKENNMHHTPTSLPCSILELASVSEGVSIGEVYKNSVHLAQEAEKWGYRRFWLAEHHNMKSIASSATSVLIGHIAGATNHIRVGSGGIMLPNHAPLIVAEQFGTLAHLYPGRIDLGLGRAPGTDQKTAQAIRPDRMQSVQQFPKEIRQIQTYFSDDNDTADVRAPVAEGMNVPVYILGSSTDSAYVAARKGLPYAFASHFAPTHLFDALDIYRHHFRPSAYLDKPYIIAGINVIAADTNEKADRLSTTLLEMILGVLTGKINYMQPPTTLTDDLRNLREHPNIQRMMKYAFIGNKASVQQQTTTFLEDTGADELMVASHIYDHNDRLRSYEIFADNMREISASFKKP